MFALHISAFFEAQRAGSVSGAAAYQHCVLQTKSAFSKWNITKKISKFHNSENEVFSNYQNWPTSLQWVLHADLVRGDAAYQPSNICHLHLVVSHVKECISKKCVFVI